MWAFTNYFDISEVKYLILAYIRPKMVKFLNLKENIFQKTSDNIFAEVTRTALFPVKAFLTQPHPSIPNLTSVSQKSQKVLKPQNTLCTIALCHNIN